MDVKDEKKIPLCEACGWEEVGVECAGWGKCGEKKLVFLNITR